MIMTAHDTIKITQEERQKLKEHGLTLMDIFDECRDPQIQLEDASIYHVSWKALDEGFSVGQRYAMLARIKQITESSYLEKIAVRGSHDRK
jgi:hypothetical protein